MAEYDDGHGEVVGVVVAAKGANCSCLRLWGVRDEMRCLTYEEKSGCGEGVGCAEAWVGEGDDVLRTRKQGGRVVVKGGLG